MTPAYTHELAQWHRDSHKSLKELFYRRLIRTRSYGLFIIFLALVTFPFRGRREIGILAAVGIALITPYIYA